MPEASRHAKPKQAAIKIRTSILAAASLAGVAAAFIVLPGAPGAPKPARRAVPVTSAAVAVNGDQETLASVHYDLEGMRARLILRARAAARHRQHAAPAVSQPTRQPAAQQTQPAAQPTPVVTARSGQDAASSPLGICIRDAEEGGSYAWGPGNGGGAYQFALSTWEKYGGAASEYGVAGPAYQDQIFDNAIAAGGASNWTAYDGC